ncbi:hypothetical protein EGH21_19365 [Halomicroarcula sp. F13]|uniref:Uncharacterized protein n=1 Tax=Haloarcula rubra TaxID=2487747 RepID=A0AAW4PVW6_9EURY|nr:hypothetical protein [Halomicroarcula rubra]MBX0325188.1 hypothetical protein [Halomicroarcula rubra]
MIEELSILEYIQEAYLEDATWAPETVTVNNQPVSELSRSEFESLVEQIDSRPRWFRSFQLAIPASSPYETETQVLTLQNGVGFEQGGVTEMLSESDEDSADWAGRISNHFSDGEHREGVELIFEALGISDIDELEISITVNKSHIVEDFCDENSVGVSDADVQLWTSKETLGQWIERSSVEHIIDRQFNDSSTPYHYFLENEGVEESRFLGFVSAHSLENGRTDFLPVSCQENYRREQEILSSVFEDTKFSSPPVSPLVFDNPVIRGMYQSVFVFAATACLASDYSLSRDSFEAETKTDRHHTRSEFDFNEPSDVSFDDQPLNDLYSLLEQVLHGDGPSSLNHWHQAVATHCSSFTEIPLKRREIVHYCGFLQEEAAKQELEQLQNTVEEAFELTRTVANSLSEASQSLTSDLQKVIITLLAAIVTNFVLILRYSDLHVLAPFSVAAIAAILIFYFPIIQNEIDETQSVMENRTGDFIIYLSEIRSHVGTRVFDLEKIEGQYKVHLRTAFNSLQNARQTTSRIYLLLVLIWAIIIFYGLLIIADNTFIGLQNSLSDLGLQTSTNQGQGTIKITILVSTVPAIWLLYKLISYHYSSEGKFLSCSLTPVESPNDPEINFPQIEDESTSMDEVDIDFFENATPRHYFDFCPLLLTILFISIIAIAGAAICIN